MRRGQRPFNHWTRLDQQPAAMEQSAALWHFGKLVANDDMHEGNLSFQPALPGQAGCVSPHLRHAADALRTGARRRNGFTRV
jgi:hypothetical protein